MLTKEQERRVISAAVETQRTLDRAMRYSPQFRDQTLIAECEAHLEKLAAMLAQNGSRVPVQKLVKA